MAHHVTYFPEKTADGKFRVFFGFSSDTGSGCGFSPAFDSKEECNEWLHAEKDRRPPGQVTVDWKNAPH